MSRLVFVGLACVLALAGCGDDDNPTSPTRLPSVFSAMLSPAEETPPITNAESVGRGAAQIQFDVTRDAANVITAATATFYFTLSGFPADTTIVGAHIHNGPRGVAGPIVINTGILSASPVPLSNGSVEFRSAPVAVAPALAQSVIDNPGAFYFNVHSPLNPAGFARGQLQRVQ
jgi:hypothetical protein